jgi:hypothetical protein
MVVVLGLAALLVVIVAEAVVVVAGLGHTTMVAVVAQE